MELEKKILTKENVMEYIGSFDPVVIESITTFSELQYELDQSNDEFDFEWANSAKYKAMEYYGIGDE